MSARIAAYPVKLAKAAGVVGTVSALLFVFVIAHRAPMWILQVGMLACLTGALAWPPKTFRVASTWVLWLATAASLVLRFFL